MPLKFDPTNQRVRWVRLVMVRPSGMELLTSTDVDDFPILPNEIDTAHSEHLCC